MNFKKWRFLFCSVSLLHPGDPDRHYCRQLYLQLFIASIGIISLSLLVSCSKLVEIKPPSTSVTSDNIYANDATAASVLTGVYASLSFQGPLGASSINSISLVSGLSADELILYGGSSNANKQLGDFYQNRLTAGLSSPATFSIWNDLYAKIYIVNLALERMSVSGSLSTDVKQQLMGEAKFLRAFFYFYLVNLYGDVPLTTTSDYKNNSTLLRTAKSKVYEQIVSDLKDAQNVLSNNYIAADATTNTLERVRPNKWSATAFLSRVFLYNGDWTNAENQATAVINNTILYDTTSLITVFLKNSKEALWQLQPVNTGWNTEDARIFVLPSTGPTSNSPVEGFPVYLSNQLLNAFEAGDQRKVIWMNTTTVGSGPFSATYGYPYKYKNATLNAPVTEYTMVLRLGEQYLIRAEARAHSNNIPGGLSDLNVIRHRAGLPNATANDQTALLHLIYHERQVELFTEWGHRWLDLKRTGKVDEVMSIVAPLKGASWSPNWVLYPIPLYDITQNPNLVQNAGY